MMLPHAVIGLSPVVPEVNSTVVVSSSDVNISECAEVNDVCSYVVDVSSDENFVSADVCSVAVSAELAELDVAVVVPSVGTLVDSSRENAYS